jgi:hypothetical protein
MCKYHRRNHKLYMWNETAWCEIIHIRVFSMYKRLFPCGIVTLIHFRFSKYHIMKWKIVTFDIFRAYFMTLPIAGLRRVGWIGRLMNDVMETKQRLCLVCGLSQHLSTGTEEDNKNLRIAYFPAEIRNKHHPNTRQKRYRWTKVLLQLLLFKLMFYVFIGVGFPMHRDLIWSIVRPL